MYDACFPGFGHVDAKDLVGVADKSAKVRGAPYHVKHLSTAGVRTWLSSGGILKLIVYPTTTWIGSSTTRITRDD